VDSRRSRRLPVSVKANGFWGIVWTAGLSVPLAQLVMPLAFLGDSVDSRQTTVKSTRYTCFQFLGDSVDSRRGNRSAKSDQNGSGFWGIVWTAGEKPLHKTATSWAGFWGIVWTAGCVTLFPEVVRRESFWGIVWTAGLHCSSRVW